MKAIYIYNLEVSKEDNKLKIEHYHFRKSFLTYLLTFNEEYKLNYYEIDTDDNLTNLKISSEI